jgi:hypothetical protein
VGVRRLAGMFGACVCPCVCLDRHQVSNTISVPDFDPSGGVVPNAAVNFVAPERGV